MSILPALMVCVSTVLPYSVTVGAETEKGTIAYRSPVQCWTPPVQIEQKQAASGKVADRIAEARPVAKKRPRGGCKPGRVRNSRGRCARP